MSDWYIERDEEQLGPYAWEYVIRLAAAGRIRPDDLLREEGGHPTRADDFDNLQLQRSPVTSTARTAMVSHTGLREKNFQPRPVPSSGPITIPRFLIGLVAISVVLAGWVYWSKDHRGLDLTLPAPVVAAGPRPTDAECREFADRIVLAATSDGIPDETLIDFKALGERALDGLPIPPKFRDGVVRPGLLKRIRERLGERFSFKFLRVRDVDGEKRVVVRILSDAGVNYLEFIVEKEPAGNVRAKDIYNYFAGERLSETLRSMAIPVAADVDSRIRSKLRGKDRVVAANIEKLDEINRASQAGDSEQVLALYPALPPEVQDLKIVQLHRCKAASASLEGEAFTDVLDDVQRHLGDDPRLSLIYVDYYIHSKEFAKAHAAIDRLYETTGDSYLRILQANTLSDEERLDEAVAEARKATEGDPELERAWMTRLLLEIKAQKFDDVVTTLREADRHLIDVDWTAVWEEPDYAPFTKTPQFEKWADEEP